MAKFSPHVNPQRYRGYLMRKRRARRALMKFLLVVLLLAGGAFLIFHTFFPGQNPLDLEDEPALPVSAPVEQYAPGFDEGLLERPTNQTFSLAGLWDTRYLELINRQHAAQEMDERRLVRVTPRLDARDDSVQVAHTVMDALIELFSAANAAGVGPFFVASGFRDFAHQVALYETDIPRELIMPPGHSEHHTGLAVDIFALPHIQERYGTHAGLDWLAENAWRYGFILRYLEDKAHITEIDYEPWHFRYVGIPHAFYIMENGLVLEEYIQLLQDLGELEITVGDQVYRVIHQMPIDGTITVPNDENLTFSISGDNLGGVIITMRQASAD